MALTELIDDWNGVLNEICFQEYTLGDVELPVVETTYVLPSDTVRFLYSYGTECKTEKQVERTVKDKTLTLNDVVNAIEMFVKEWIEWVEQFNEGMDYYSYWGQGNTIKAHVQAIEGGNVKVSIIGVWSSYPEKI